jgi:hypothetical protein
MLARTDYIHTYIPDDLAILFRLLQAGGASDGFEAVMRLLDTDNLTHLKNRKHKTNRIRGP